MFDNPLLKRELLFLARQSRSPKKGLALALVTLLLVGLIYYVVLVNIPIATDPSAAASAWLGIMVVQYLLLLLLTPGYACNAFAREKEQQTWELLTLTLLSPWEILWGKFASRLLPLLAPVLLLAPLSLYCSLHTNGSGVVEVGAHQAILSYFTTILSLLFFITLSLYLSWRMKRTLYAQMSGYTILIGGLTLVTTLIASALSIAASSNSSFDNPFMWVNPVYLIVRSASATSHEATLYVLCGLFLYTTLTVLMLWHIVTRIRSRETAA